SLRAVSTIAGPEERGGRGAGGSGEAQAQGQPRDSAMAPMQPSLGPPRDEPRVFGLDNFNGDNFAEWSFKMENIFDHYDLLEVMEGTEKRPENDPEKSPAVSTIAGPEERGGRGAGGSGEAQAQGQPRDSAMAPMQPSLRPPRDEPRVFGLDNFNGDNFAEWSFKMENIFDHYDLLEVMEGTEKRPENDPEKSPWVWKSAQGYLLLGQVLGSS
ncbi:unnamed protein product, partial [Closterium sp. NIES-54]